ncbi:hypothetical protein [Egbenema bharatensis]|uniref:hypothetical protein n=1 Tax=Egbenema bharatensis TaxID=3463334 RepID=UPI003A89B30A
MVNRPRSIDSLLQDGYSVDIGGYLSRGWELFKRNVGGFIGFAVLLGGINIGFMVLIAMVDPAAGDPEQPPSAIASLINGISTVISIPLQAGFYVVAFKLVKQRPTTFSDFFRGFNDFLQLFLASLVSGIFIILGFLLLIIPGIYLAVAYSFVVPLVIERKMEFWEAMETSRKVITKQWFAFFGLGVLMFFINLAGAIACGLGLLITIPLTYCTYTAAYEAILGMSLADTGYEPL